MKKQNTTKKALLMSVLSTVLCLTMLVGSTFAWFTDSATTGVNKIVSGNLDIKLSYKNAAGTAYSEVSANTTDLFVNKDGGAILWEPGVASVCYFKIENLGSLSLKYVMSVLYKDVVTANEGAIKLSDALVSAIVPMDSETVFESSAAAIEAANGTNSVAALGYANDANPTAMAAKDTDYFAMVVYMPDTVGNDYNVAGGLAIELYINLVATQLNAEADSFGTDYDKDATFPEKAVATFSSTTDTNIVGKGIKATIPAGTALQKEDGTPLAENETVVLSVKESAAPNNFEVSFGTNQKTYDVSLETATGEKLTSSNNDITVTIPYEKNLSGEVVVYHYDTLVEGTTYDAATGEVTFKTKNFSPFTVAELPIDTTWYNDTDTEFTLTEPEQLFGLAKLVNQGNSFAKKTIKLGADIDLANREWTPIGTSSKPFSGIFDGQDNTVSNLLVTGNKSYVGFFGYTTNGAVSNLTIENADVSGHLGVGAVAGSPYTSKYTDISIKGDVEINGYAYVGGAFGRNAYADLTNITIAANEGSFVRAESENYRTYVGGVVGFMGEGKITVKDVTSNIDVYGSTVDVGGITGIAHYGNTFVNCTSSGDVTIGNDAETEIGGIAGVWMNSAAGAVTFENCSYTGTLSHCSDTNQITGTKYTPSSDAGNLIIK